MDDRYLKVSKVPVEYLRTIEFGNLKGKSDINPQWRIKAITEVYGLCGIGWKYEIAEIKIVEGVEGKKVVFVTVNLYVKNGEDWSQPIPGVGGDMIVEKDKNGLHENDEALKMAVTDALGNAMKYIGVASEIYEGNFKGSKYAQKPNVLVEQTPEQTPVQTQPVQTVDNFSLMVRNAFDIEKLVEYLAAKGKSQWFGDKENKFENLTDNQLKVILKNQETIKKGMQNASSI
jgi:hypothetical protein